MQVNELIDQLRNTLSKMELALGTIDEAIVWTNQDGVIEWCNKTFDNLVAHAHIEILGSNIFDLLLLKKEGQTISWKNQLVQGVDDAVNNIYEYENNNQKLFLKFKTRPLVLHNRTTIITVFRNVTKEQLYLQDILKKDKLLKEQTELLAKEKTFLDNIIGSMSNMLFVVNNDGTIKSVNKAAALMLGYKQEELIGKSLKVILAEPNSILHEIISSKSIANREMVCKTKKGQIKQTLLSGSVMYDSDGNVSAIVTIAQDITERKELENRLLYLSTHDSLTNLPNRAYFEEALKAALHRSARTKKNLALFYMDLDHFKIINDTLGHSTGDAFLVKVASCIQNSLRKDDIAVRLGGDEFALIINGLNTPQDAALIAEKLLRNLRNSCSFHEQHLNVTASLGIAFHDHAKEISPSDLRKNADIAMYKAKAAGRNNYQFYREQGENIL